jgi:hypothetical protein
MSAPSFDAIKDSPDAEYRRPAYVLDDERLTLDEKRTILEMWPARDEAEQSEVATALRLIENLPLEGPTS